MGGYGSASGRVKGKCYYDSGGHKVTDPNAIAVAEHYISLGKYVVFLQEKPGQPRADLSVDKHHEEVKGLKTMSPNSVDKQLQHAFEQIHGDDFKYPPDKRNEGKVIILSRHDTDISEEEIRHAMFEGFRSQVGKVL